MHSFQKLLKFFEKNHINFEILKLAKITEYPVSLNTIFDFDRISEYKNF